MGGSSVLLSGPALTATSRYYDASGRVQTLIIRNHTSLKRNYNNNNKMFYYMVRHPRFFHILKEPMKMTGNGNALALTTSSLIKLSPFLYGLILNFPDSTWRHRADRISCIPFSLFLFSLLFSSGTTLQLRTFNYKGSLYFLVSITVGRFGRTIE